VWTLKFKNDGNILISGSTDKSLKLWDTNSGKLIETLNGHENAVKKKNENQ
jgi:WD40 repeat protein